MAITKSFQQYGTMPSAILSDGILTIPLWAVTTMTLTESYHLPPIGSTGSKSVIGTHDDSITLAGVLVGAERYIWKVGLETLAESSRRGSALASFTGGAAGGLVLVTSMTIRTDMHVTSLTFTASAARRDALDVSLGMAHLPLPSALGTLLDAASVGIGALADLGGN